MDTAARYRFDRDTLSVEPGSQLATMAQISPAACVLYSGALESELEGVLATCTREDSMASPVELFEKLHALKNMVIPTGCQQILSACTDLHTRAAWSRDRAEVKADVAAIAQAALDLVRAFQRALDGGASR